jgi:hypothetical protein
MHLSLEILDHIFSFLVSHRETLIACSNDPVLSPIIERHLYYHMVVKVGHGETDHAYESNQLSQLISENPRILYHVRILQLHVHDFWWWNQNWSFKDFLDEFAPTLLMFPVLECVMLTLSDARSDTWSWSNAFRTALEDRLKLSTFKEIHLTGSKGFPFSILDHCKNIENLTLSGSFIAEGQYCDQDLPRLKSLSLLTHFISSSLFAWVKLHINGLQSLTCGLSSMALLPKILGVCSGTLKNLEVDLTLSPCKIRGLL